MSVFCSQAQFLLYLDYSYGLSSSTATGKLDWQLVLLGGEGGWEQRGRTTRSGVDPPGEDEGKRKGGEEESDMGRRDLEH